MMALSVHSVFEGIAVGLADSKNELWEYIIAIGLHKWAAAMSLGISISKSFEYDNKMFYTLISLFSLATPVGVLIGMKI